MNQNTSKFWGMQEKYSYAEKRVYKKKMIKW